MRFIIFITLIASTICAFGDYPAKPLQIITDNPIVYFKSSFTVPKKPSSSADYEWLYIWPGLQPDPYNLDQPGIGVIQPVLTISPKQFVHCSGYNNDADTWWISAQYVNNSLQPSCFWDKKSLINNLSVGDLITVKMINKGNKGNWVQNITIASKNTTSQIDSMVNTVNDQNVSLERVIDGPFKQDQKLAEFAIEHYPNDWYPNITNYEFTNIIVKTYKKDGLFYRQDNKLKTRCGKLKGEFSFKDRYSICTIEKILMNCTSSSDCSEPSSYNDAYRYY